MNFISKYSFFLLIFLAIGLMSCTDDDDNDNVIAGTNSIVNYLEKNDRFSLLAKTVAHAGMSGYLNGNAGTYTFFAPPNEAVEAYLNEQGYDSVPQMPQAEAAQFVNNHLLQALTLYDAFSTSYLKTTAEVPLTDSTTTTVSLFVDRTGEEPIFNASVRITQPDVLVDNGILHEIDQIMPLPTLATFLEADTNLQPFYNKLTNHTGTTNFTEIIQATDERKTLFVPNEAAVTNFDNQNITDVTELDNIYRNHFMDSLQIAADFRTGFYPTQATENYTGNQTPVDAYINTQVGMAINGTASTVISDIVTINGVIHVTDAVLEVPSLTTFIQADEALQTFVNLCERDDQLTEAYLAKLSDTDFSDDAPFTVFAPTNIAFNDLEFELFPDEQGDLTDITGGDLTQLLNLHIIPNEAFLKSDFTAGNLTSLGGDVIQLQPQDSSLVDPATRDAQIIPLDGRAANGVLHKLERVLLPN